MGASGGFHIVELKDVELAKIVLQDLKIGIFTDDTGIQKLFGKDVYIGCWGDNFHGITMGIIPDHIIECNECDMVQAKEHEEFLKTDLYFHSLKNILHPYGHPYGYSDHNWECDFEDCQFQNLLDKMNSIGIKTVGDLYKAWERAADWSTFKSFETWT